MGEELVGLGASGQPSQQEEGLRLPVPWEQGPLCQHTTFPLPPHRLLLPSHHQIHSGCRIRKSPKLESVG